MKKVLKGKVYCTETAKEVARIENGCIFYHSVKILFRLNEKVNSTWQELILRL